MAEALVFNAFKSIAKEAGVSHEEALNAMLCAIVGFAIQPPAQPLTSSPLTEVVELVGKDLPPDILDGAVGQQ